MYYFILTLFVIVAVLLIILALLQKGRGDVGAAFGSAMGQSIFGAGGVDTILTKATYWLGGIFLILAILLSIIPKEKKGSIIESELLNESGRPAQGHPKRTEEGRGDNTLPSPKNKNSPATSKTKGTSK